MIIDTHQHFWRYTKAEFGWLADNMAAIRRDYLPDDLAPILTQHKIDGAIAVQARQTEAETQWLLELAAAHPWIRGVVGWAPLTALDIDHRIAKLKSAGKLVGLRHVLQAEPDAYMQHADFNAGVDTVGRHELVYELLILERQLPRAIALVDRHPNVRFVLDHLGKPRNDIAQLDPWRANLRQLAERPNVSCKLSGGITEIDLQWKPSKLRRYFDTALDVFGPQRLMFGSNWPVSEAAGGYAAWLNAIDSWADIAGLGQRDRDRLFATNAIEIYRLEEPK